MPYYSHAAFSAWADVGMGLVPLAGKISFL